MQATTASSREIAALNSHFHRRLVRWPAESINGKWTIKLDDGMRRFDL